MGSNAHTSTTTKVVTTQHIPVWYNKRLLHLFEFVRTTVLRNVAQDPPNDTACHLKGRILQDAPSEQSSHATRDILPFNQSKSVHVNVILTSNWRHACYMPRSHDHILLYHPNKTSNNRSGNRQLCFPRTVSHLRTQTDRQWVGQGQEIDVSKVRRPHDLRSVHQW